MASSKPVTVKEFLESLPPDRREVISVVRAVILKNLPAGYEEAMQWGAISYVIPLSRYPNTYNGQALSIAALASQKNYISLHLMCLYGHKPTEEWFRKEWAASGKKLDMGKACVRFRKLDEVPLDVIGRTIARIPVETFLKVYEESRKK